LKSLEVPEETMLTDEKEDVLVAQPQVHLHALVVLPLVREQGRWRKSPLYISIEYRNV